jgi:taurine dioxygenase/putative 2-oxoglutarate oxygenase
MAVQFRPISDVGGGKFGAEVIGVNPNLQVDDETFQAIEAAWYRHSILLFRGVEMSVEDHIAFTKRLGPLHLMPVPEHNLDGHPEIFVVTNALKPDGTPLGIRGAGMGFHSDGEDKPVPNAGSFLYAHRVPPSEGDTLFADMCAAYEALPAEIRGKIAGRRARFSRAALHHINYPDLPMPEQFRDRPDVFHPAVRRHPKSGRVALYVGRWAYDIEGLPEQEGHELVTYLQAFAHEPRFVYRHQWRKGDAVLWDNRCVQHCATPFDETRYVRLMHRTTLEGETPLMA